MDTPPRKLAFPKVAEASWVNLGILKCCGRIIFISASKKGEVAGITLFLLYLDIVSSGKRESTIGKMNILLHVVDEAQTSPISSQVLPLV